MLWICFVLHNPQIVVVLMWVERDLLLPTASGVHVSMGVQISALCVPVSNADFRTISYICRHVLHPLIVEGGLELAGHESISIPRINKAEKMNRKHGHVKSDGNDDQAKNAGKKMLKPQTLYFDHD